MNEKISIIIPIYNGEKHLLQCLESVVNQTYTNLEIICVNDGSTDSTPEILQKFARNDARIKILDRAHQNAGEARNTGFEFAQGEFSMFLDADDIFKPEMVQKCLANALKHNSDIVLFQYKPFNELKEKSYPNVGVNTDCLPVKAPLNFKECKDIFAITAPNPWSKFYKTSFIKENNLKFSSLNSCNDLTFVMLSLVMAKRISYLLESFVAYRISNSQISINRQKTAQCSIIALQEIEEELKKMEIFEEVENSFLNLVKNVITFEMTNCSGSYLEDFSKAASPLLKRVQ